VPVRYFYIEKKLFVMPLLQKFQAAMTKEGNFVVASGSAVTLWSNKGRLLHEYGMEKFKFCKQLCLNEDGGCAYIRCFQFL